MVAQPSCHRLPSVKFHTSLEVATAHGLFRTLHKSTTGSRTILAPPGLAPLVLYRSSSAVPCLTTILVSASF
jgi:hypothetical protein